MIQKHSITKKNLLYNFIFRASLDKKIRTYYHLLEPLFHAMSDNNMYLNLGYMDLNDKSEKFSVVESQKNMVNVVTKGFKKKGKWLDVGCGTGAPACFLGVSNPNLEIDGINIVKPQIEKANQLSEKYQCDDRVRFHYGDAQQIPFENETYDSVYAIESAFHFDSKLKFIKESNRILKEGGKLSVADIVIRPEYRKFSDWYKISIAKHGLATREFYSSYKWTNMLKNNDYVDIQVNDITLNVSKVLPKWIGLIQKNENELLHLYPKLFLTMLIKCLNYAYKKGSESPFGYLLITATKK